MAKSGPPPIVFILLFLLLAGGGWFFFLNKPAPTGGGASLRIDGSTSMVIINQNLKNGFQGKFSGTTVDTKANGSEKGIQDLAAGTVDIAAISRPLTAQEQAQGLAAVPVALDTIALVVGINNPFKGGLTSAQVQDIFKGNAQDWSKVGGPAGPIKVINRPEVRDRKS